MAGDSGEDPEDQEIRKTSGCLRGWVSGCDQSADRPEDSKGQSDEFSGRRGSHCNGEKDSLVRLCFRIRLHSIHTRRLRKGEFKNEGLVYLMY